MGMPRHPAPGMPPFHGEHPPAYYPMTLPPPGEKPLGPIPPQAPMVRNLTDTVFKKNEGA